ncbi:MAG: type II secretion system protein [Anaerohalosphaera sp.]|nr:type II secretion system protein [Anaerohalosphaera sp.]
MKHVIQNKNNAFTLIELLVVISIIAMLLAILMPALGKVKEKAREIICRTNIKSIQLASLLYTEDNEGKMPAYPSGYGDLWINEITQYLDDMDDARFCPTTSLKKDFDPSNNISWGKSKESWVWNIGTPEPEHGSYAINGWFYSTYLAADGSSAPRTHTIEKVSQTRRPASTPVFSDSMWVDSWPLDTDKCSTGLNLDNGGNNYSMERELLNRHGDHISVGFIDGHQEAVELGKLWSLKWHNSFNTVLWMEREDGSPIYQRQR